jgi:hypothetical protein
MMILKENVADKKKRSFFKITKSVNYFWSDMKDAKKKMGFRAVHRIAEYAEKSSNSAGFSLSL